MTSTMGSNRQLRALRGATTAEANTVEAIGAAVADLVQALVERNQLMGDQVVSVTFSRMIVDTSHANIAIPMRRTALDLKPPSARKRVPVTMSAWPLATGSITLLISLGGCWPSASTWMAMS